MKFELEACNRNVPDEELLTDLVAAHAVLNSQGKKLTFRSYREAYTNAESSGECGFEYTPCDTPPAPGKRYSINVQLAFGH